MTELFVVVTAWILVGLAVTAVVLLAPAPPRPPRHARPKGWVGPPNRAPFPPVTEWPPADAALLMLSVLGTGPGLSPLNREVLRRRLRVTLNEDLGRPVV